MKKIIKGVLGVIVGFAAIVIVGALLSDSDTPNTGNGELQNGASFSATEEQSDKIVYEDDFVSVYFCGTYEQPEIIPDTCYFTLKVVNKTDGQIMVSPTNGCANDNMVTIASGAPLNINAGKTGQNAFFFNYSNLGIDDISALETLEFSLYIFDENTTVIDETENIMINL